MYDQKMRSSICSPTKPTPNIVKNCFAQRTTRLAGQNVEFMEKLPI